MKTLFIISLVLCGLLLSGAAAPVGVDEQLEAVGAKELTEELSDETRELLENIGIEELNFNSITALSPADFFAVARQLAKDAIKMPLAAFLAVAGVAVLCALLASLKGAMGNSSMDAVFSVVSVAAVASAVIAPVTDCISKSATAINECSAFLLSYVPVMASIVTVSGRPAAAAGYQTMVFAAAQLVSRISSELIVPLLGIYMALCLAGAVSTVDITALAGAVRSAVNWTLGIIMTLFVGLLGLQSIVASGADTLTLKTAKFLIGSFVPVVGGALADAIATAQSCIGLVKTAVGAFGILAAAMTFMPALFSALAWRLAVGASAAICDMLEIKPVSKVLSASGTVLGILVSLTLCFALLMIITTAIMLLVGGGT